jgi:hypothetical protein
VAEVPIEHLGVKAKGLLIARCCDEATPCRGGVTHGNCLGTCHSKGALMVVEEDDTAVMMMMSLMMMSFICSCRNKI